jgi:hypothetical protein
MTTVDDSTMDDTVPTTRVEDFYEQRKKENLEMVYKRIDKMFKVQKISKEFWKDYELVGDIEHVYGTYRKFGSYEEYWEDVRDYLKKYVELHKDNHFWSDYVNYIFTWDLKLLRNSAQLGNPFSMFTLGKKLYYTYLKNEEGNDIKNNEINIDVTAIQSECINLFYTAGKLGYYKAVFFLSKMYLLYEFIDDDGEKCSSYNIEFIHEKIKSLLELIPMLEKCNKYYRDKEMVKDIYYAAHKYKYKLKKGKTPYIFRLLELSSENFGNDRRGEMLKASYNKYKRVLKSNKRLLKLQDQSFDEICKSIVKEYL